MTCLGAVLSFCSLDCRQGDRSLLGVGNAHKLIEGQPDPTKRCVLILRIRCTAMGTGTEFITKSSLFKQPTTLLSMCDNIKHAKIWFRYFHSTNTGLNLHLPPQNYKLKKIKVPILCEDISQCNRNYFLNLRTKTREDLQTSPTELFNWTRIKKMSACSLRRTWKRVVLRSCDRLSHDLNITPLFWSAVNSKGFWMAAMLHKSPNMVKCFASQHHALADSWMFIRTAMKAHHRLTVS